MSKCCHKSEGDIHNLANNSAIKQTKRRLIIFQRETSRRQFSTNYSPIVSIVHFSSMFPYSSCSFCRNCTLFAIWNLCSYGEILSQPESDTKSIRQLYVEWSCFDPNPKSRLSCCCHFVLLHSEVCMRRWVLYDRALQAYLNKFF